MHSNSIFWHDCIVLSVVEKPTKWIAFHVIYSEYWEQQRSANKTILFGDIYEYSIHEKPFHGTITLLSAEEELGVNDTRKLHIESNAGYRTVRCKTLELLDGHVHGK